MALKKHRHSEPSLRLELELVHAGYYLVAGLDEAGRGAWAGPVVAAAVVLPLQLADLQTSLHGVRDSKRMTPAQREHWSAKLVHVARTYAVGQATAGEVDALGIIRATRVAMSRAVASLAIQPHYLLIDHLLLPEIDLPQTAMPHGEDHSLTIAAASVVAKVSRDQLLQSMEIEYPGYGFAKHKGYGTAQHRAALRSLGPCPMHRFSYAPLAAFRPPGSQRPGQPQSATR